MTNPKSNRNRAKIAIVNLGGIQIEGLSRQGKNGKLEYAVAIVQIANKFQFLRKNVQRTIERILGRGFQFLRWYSILHPDGVNVITLEDFSDFLFELATLDINKKNVNLEPGKLIAKSILKDLRGVILRERFDDAFGVTAQSQGFKDDTQKRDFYFNERLYSKEYYKLLLDAIDWYWLEHKNRNTLPSFEYQYVANEINRWLFGCDAKKIRTELERTHDITEDDLIRNYMNPVAVMRIRTVEQVAIEYIRQKQIAPGNAIFQVIKFLGYEVIDWRIKEEMEDVCNETDDGVDFAA